MVEVNDNPSIYAGYEDLRDKLYTKHMVVEVNDNPSIYAGYEDLRDKDLYAKIITYLTE